jgi:hypothetical protein
MADDSGAGFGEFKPDPSVGPIAAMIERIKVNTTIAYEKASIEALAKLKAHDLGHYIAVFAQLKLIAGLSVGPLRQAIEKPNESCSPVKVANPRTRKIFCSPSFATTAGSVTARRSTSTLMLMSTAKPYAPAIAGWSRMSVRISSR